tara:strand:+ start:3031 stop:3849 length:819 start_codon:yes stop_codon:yes gene_type:complete
MQQYFNWRIKKRGQSASVVTDNDFLAENDITNFDLAKDLLIVTGQGIRMFEDMEATSHKEESPIETDNTSSKISRSKDKVIYSLGEAADYVGKSKMTINRAIKSGKLSATKNDKGAYEIDASELKRVYEKDIAKAEKKKAKKTKDDTGVDETVLKVAETQAMVDSLRKQLRLTEDQLDMKDELIDQVKSERDRVYALITDQSKESKTKEERLNREIEALRDRVKKVNEKRQDTIKTARDARQQLVEMRRKTAELERKYQEEANKPWFKKLFG